MFMRGVSMVTILFGRVLITRMAVMVVTVFVVVTTRRLRGSLRFRNGPVMMTMLLQVNRLRKDERQHHGRYSGHAGNSSDCRERLLQNPNLLEHFDAMRSKSLPRVPECTTS